MDCTVKQHFNLVLPTTTTHQNPHHKTYSHTSRTTTSAATRFTGASTSTNRTTLSSSSQGTASATINYLPSFRNSCKNVPTREANIATTATLIAQTAAIANGCSSGVVSSCCCHRWEHENYNYYKQHAMTPSLIPETTTTTRTTTSRQQLPQQLAKQEEDKFSLSHKSYSKNNNKNMKSYIENITSYICDDRGNSKLQKCQQQRYNDILNAYQISAAPNSNTTTTTTTTTNAITNTNKINKNKSISLIGKKGTTNNNNSSIILQTASASPSTSTTLSLSTLTNSNSNSNLNSNSMSASNEMTQLNNLETNKKHNESDLTVGEVEDVCCLKFNYAARKFIKSCKTNFNLRTTIKVEETEVAEEEEAFSVRCKHNKNNCKTSSSNCCRVLPVELIDQQARSKVEVGETTNQERRTHAVTKKCNNLQTTTTNDTNNRRQLTISNTTNTTKTATTTATEALVIRCCSKNSASVSRHCDKVNNGSDFVRSKHSDSDGSGSSRSCSIMCNKNFTTSTNECDAGAHSELLRIAAASTTTTRTTFHRTLAILHYLSYYSLWLELCRRSLLHQMMQTMNAVCSRQVVSKLSFAITRKWLLCVLVLMLAASGDCWAGRQDMPMNCTFPARWEGSWFLSGYQQSIHIKGSQFSYRGKCAASDGNKYLIVDEKGCHRCLVIYEKHKNVLQYKESECEGDSIYMHQSNPSALAMRSVLKQTEHRGGAHPNINGHSRLSSSDQYIMRSNDDMNDYFCKGRETLQNLCDQIPGDALLYSLFRESAEPVKCPLKGPFVFTYNRGHGECKSPVSNIESCTEESRLLLSFQACPDVQGTESTVEELTCLATWKDGNSRYLVGLVSHHHAISNEERFRCFVYEKISPLMGVPTMAISTKDAEYKLAQSGDATCNGLDSAEVGSRIMSLRKPPLAERCDFPVWFKGPRHWHGLMGNSVYNYHSNDGSIHIIKPNGYMETRALCEQINKQTSTEMMAVVHYTTGCQSGFMCMMFYRRDTHVIEIQTGRQAARLEDACAPDYFDIHKMPYITLLASNPEQQICPMEGLYNLRGAIGPPYMTTRHKRNHNNKMHASHGHHHQLNEETFTGLNHKRHTTLSFRNGDKTLDRSSWHANTRGLPVRSRRNTPTSDERHHASAVVSGTTEMLLREPNTNETAIDLVLRNRRNVVPGCITNVKAQRQLWIGCTDPDIIDVRPLCNDEGEEEYSCHGSWSENGTVHIIARHKSTKHGVCISYRPTEGKSAKLYIGDTCYRSGQKVADHILEASLSVYGKCGETHVSSGAIRMPSWFSTLFVLSVAAALTVHR